jgi:hypothetical protein
MWDGLPCIDVRRFAVSDILVSLDALWYQPSLKRQTLCSVRHPYKRQTLCSVSHPCKRQMLCGISHPCKHQMLSVSVILVSLDALQCQTSL